MAAQFLTTSKLSNIISMINLGRQSGILRIIRGQGAAREVGQIKFIDGEPASALLGHLTGQGALNVLTNWGECIYSFDEQAITDLGDGDLTAGSDGRSPTDSGRYPQYGGSNGSWPQYGTPQPGFPPSMPSSSASPSTYSQPATSSPSSFSLRGYPTDMGNDGAYGSGAMAQSQPPYPQQQNGYAQADPRAQAQNQAPLHPDVLAAIPRRTALSEHVEQLPLDRRERMVLLLIDGRRTLSDLARLTRRSERDILAVINHMAGLGLVQISA